MKKGVGMIGALLGISIPVCFVIKMQQDCINRLKEQADKNHALFMLMNQWVNIKLEGKNLADYLKKKGCSKIAVYGMGAVGECLVRELRDSGVEIAYAIDDHADTACFNIKSVPVEDCLSDVDAVVTTFPGEFDKACDILTGKLNCPIIAIEDMLNEV